ncbi:hypothetical protein, partial [Klebsiella pneumoniae]|uniref:hypothetical protein n=1 Tax=Klebsiella pneumoniae TaxID=573 RepID=UPI001C8F4EFF
AYEIEDIEKYIKSKMGASVTAFSLKPNNNTLKSELYCSEVIDFSKENTIGKLLGFDDGVYDANKQHVSELPIDIIKVNSIRVECNITRGSFLNGVEGHVIHEFYPDVP